MNVTPRAAAGLAATASPVARSGGLARPPSSSGTADGRLQRVMPLMRKIEVACLLPDGRDTSFSRIVPAQPAFEDAFAVFSRNAAVSTDRGLITVEDVQPGDKVRTATGFRTLLWKGATLVVPHAPGQDPVMARMTRLTADSLGIARPMPDLILGPRARLTHRGPGVRTLTGAEAALIPARDFVDGEGVLALTPPAPVQVFQLGFAGHERVLTQGVEVEALHPGPAHALGLRGELLALYLSCFPHMADLADFGPPLLPRLNRRDLDLFDVA